MSLEELQQVYNSLKECDPDVEYFNWGPSLNFAQERKKQALKILRKAIKEKKNEPAN
jgi:hypothetical protein